MWGAIASALLLVAPGASAAESRWAVDPLASRAEFNVKFLGLVRINGRFSRFAATIEPADGETMRVTARFEASGGRNGCYLRVATVLTA